MSAYLSYPAEEIDYDLPATHPAVAHAETSLIYEHRRGPGIWGAADPA